MGAEDTLECNKPTDLAVGKIFIGQSGIDNEY